MTDDKNDSVAAERLRAARTNAGFKSASAAARQFGWGDASYRHHENGTRAYGMAQAVEYARAFRVSVGWLLNISRAMQSTRVPIAAFYMSAYAHNVGEDAHIRAFADDAFERYRLVMLPELRVDEKGFSWELGKAEFPPFHLIPLDSISSPQAVISDGYLFAYRVWCRAPQSLSQLGDVVVVDSSQADIGPSSELWMLRDQDGPLLQHAYAGVNGEVMLLPNSLGQVAISATEIGGVDVIGKVIWRGGEV